VLDAGEASEAHEPQRHFDAAATRLPAAGEDLHLGILRLTDEVHPSDLIPKVVRETILAVRVDAQPGRALLRRCRRREQHDAEKRTQQAKPHGRWF
jgi:hypothetical protein